MAGDTAESHSSPSSGEKPAVAKDRLGYELGPDAQIWRDYENITNNEDDKLFKQWDHGLNDLALFATLFSAVTTAFIIEGQKDMKEDYAKQAVFALSAIASGQPFARPAEPFIITTRARAMNCLWIASLLLSLAAAFIAIMGKDWIGMYRLRPVCGPRQWAEIRTYRIRYVEQWRLSAVIGSAPVLLHISLILFGAGLVLFFSEDPFTHRLTLGLSAATGSLYLFTGLTAVIFAPSPYKSPETQSVRWLLASFWRLHCHALRALRRIRRSHDVAQQQPAEAEPAPDGQAPSAALVADEQTTRRKLAGFFISTTWTDSHDKPVPHLIAEALSRLRDASSQPKTLDAIIHALGDIHVAPKLARHVSLTLKNPIQTFIRGHWERRDLSIFKLSRYILALANLGWEDRSFRKQICSNFVVRSTKEPQPEGSEDILVALFLASDKFKDILPKSVQKLCPSAIDRRTMAFLVSRLAQRRPDDPLDITDWSVANWSDTNSEMVIVLMNSCWSSMNNDYSEFSRAFKRLLQPRIDNCLPLSSQRRPASVVDFMSFFLSQTDIFTNLTARKAAVQLLQKFLESEKRPRKHPWLVYSFGSVVYGFGGSKVTCVWNDLDPDGKWSQSHLQSIRLALPLDQYDGIIHADKSPPASEEGRDFVLCLLRTVTRLLSPLRPWLSGSRRVKEDPGAVVGPSAGQAVSDLDLCVRCLHAHLCSPRSVLPDTDKVSIAVEILEQWVLARAKDTEDQALLWDIIGVISKAVTESIMEAVTKDAKRKAARLLGLFLGTTEPLELDEGSEGTTGAMSWVLEEHLKAGAKRQISPGAMGDTEREKVEGCINKLKTLSQFVPRDPRWEAVEIMLTPWPLQPM